MAKINLLLLCFLEDGVHTAEAVLDHDGALETLEDFLEVLLIILFVEYVPVLRYHVRYFVMSLYVLGVFLIPGLGLNPFVLHFGYEIIRYTLVAIFIIFTVLYKFIRFILKLSVLIKIALVLGQLCSEWVTSNKGSNLICDGVKVFYLEQVEDFLVEIGLDEVVGYFKERHVHFGSLHLVLVACDFV